MLFDKPFSDIGFDDIMKLSHEMIDESMILDYKQELNDDSIIKQVTAFSNTKGGYLVYGIAETGKGGHPANINGIDKDTNAERLEQIILSNVVPRVSVQIKKIPMPDSNMMILLVKIPEGQYKPYYNNHDKKYYKRYNFCAIPMDENEIEWLYQSRFYGMGKLDRYLDEAIFHSQSHIPHRLQVNSMQGHILITPLKIDGQMFEPSQEFGQKIMKMHTDIDKCSDYLSGTLMPSKFGIKWEHDQVPHNKDHISKVEVHRNGLVHSMKRCGGSRSDATRELDDYALACNLLNTIKFTASFYSQVNYIGKVKIKVEVSNCNDSVLVDGERKNGMARKCDSDSIVIERQWESWKLQDDRILIAKDIMDELSNYYGLWSSELFEHPSTLSDPMSRS